VITIASALNPDGCDVIASLPDASLSWRGPDPTHFRY